MSLSIQFLSLATMVVVGVYLGCMFDTLDRFSFHWKDRRIFAYLIEISFWLMQSLLLFYLLLLVNQGEVRFSYLIAVFLGFMIYQRIVAQWYKRVLEVIIRIVTAFYRFFYRAVEVLIVYPLRWTFHVLLALVIFLFQLFCHILRLIWQLIYIPIRTIGRLLWRLIPKNAHKYLVSFAGFYSKIENIILRWKSFWNKRR